MLTATISHDMRTPLNAIISVSKNLINELAVNQPCKKTWTKFLKIVFNSASLLNFQVNDLIDLFKIRTGKFKPVDSIVNVHELVIEIFEVFSIQTKEKGLELEVKRELNFPPLLYIDSGRLKQVLVNLISNSLKFTFSGSIQVYLAFDYTHEKLNVTVADTGIGIDDSDKHRVFEMFSKIESTLLSNTTGIGMGLSISRKILSSLGGTIQIEPRNAESQRGTQINFTMDAVHV